MSWNVEQITVVALGSARADHAAFEAIGLAEMRDARVLDVGCLDGFNTRLKFGPYENLSQIVGIDPNEEGIEQARGATCDTRFRWEAASLQDFDAPHASFDVIYLGHVFQHLPDKDLMLAHMMRLLKPGGFVVIKTIDDSLKASSPDPEHLMSQVLDLYDTYVRPHTPHTCATDRYNGSKCYGLLKAAGFSDVSIGVFHESTAEKTTRERLALFERMTYFRRKVPACCGADVQARMDDLLARWRELFLRDDYYFDTPTVMALARKAPTREDESGEGSGGASTGDRADAEGAFAYVGPVFGTPRSRAHAISKGRWTITPMTEDDLGEVMGIEVEAFPDPWTPLAYATELRHNPQARYVVARDAAGDLCGYLGWWHTQSEAIIAHVATATNLRRTGLGRTLVELSCESAAQMGASAMLLQVRKENDAARAFYQALGFQETGVSRNYYTNPDDDGIMMARPLTSPTSSASASTSVKERLP